MPLIETQHKLVPWRWILLLAIIGQARILVFFAAGSMTFTIRKFVESPLVINSVFSLDVLFNVLVAAPCLYYSDRIWTRMGRRLPFVVTSFSVLAVVLLLLPLAGSAVPTSVLIVLFLIFWDVGSTYETLVMEIIPPQQRGRASALNAWMFNANLILQSLVITGRFDDVVHWAGFTLRGEELVYWWGGGAALFCLLFLILFVREQPPVPTHAPPPTCENKRGLTGALSSILRDPQLWPVYLLVVAILMTQTSLGAIEPLLFTEQWGYSKQDMGTNVLVGGLINLAIIIPLVGLIADRMDRLAMLGLGVGGVLLAQIIYYVFVHFILPDHRPSIAQIILFGQITSAIGQLSTVAMQPLIFEYIPRDKMGTAQAGLNFVRSITRLITLNGIGFWVATYSRWFLPEGHYDYFSGYLFIIGMNALGCSLLIFFALQVRKGRFQPWGRTEFKSLEDPVVEAKR